MEIDTYNKLTVDPIPPTNKLQLNCFLHSFQCISTCWIKISLTISVTCSPFWRFYHPIYTLCEAHEFTRCVTRSLVLCVCFVDRCLSFVLFRLAIVLSVLQYTDSDYPFDYLQTLLHTRCFVGSVLRIYLVFLLCGVPNVGNVSWLSFLIFITFL